MKTVWLLLGKYDGEPVIPLATVCRDYFYHLSPTKLAHKINIGEIPLPIVRIEPLSQKTAKGVHIADLAQWIDMQREAGRKEMWQLTGAPHLDPKREP